MVSPATGAVGAAWAVAWRGRVRVVASRMAVRAMAGTGLLEDRELVVIFVASWRGSTCRVCVRVTRASGESDRR
ncbi:hypothetical protein GCM10009837_11500 [Streptomyces durmitorensis]